jgi:hypothetical protein
MSFKGSWLLWFLQMKEEFSVCANTKGKSLGVLYKRGHVPTRPMDNIFFWGVFANQMTTTLFHFCLFGNTCLHMWSPAREVSLCLFEIFIKWHPVLHLISSPVAYFTTIFCKLFLKFSKLRPKSPWSRYQLSKFFFDYCFFL